MKKRGIIIAAALLCVLAAVFALAYFTLMPDGVAGDKTINAEVVIAGESVRTLEISTDAEFLRQALEEHNLIEGEESSFGLMVTAVDGVTADESKQEWWCVTRNGEWLDTGVDTTPIADGEHYELTLMVGYDN